MGEAEMTGWIDEYYKETKPEIRQKLLEENATACEEDEYRKKLWIIRHGKRKPKEDTFVRCLMEMKFLFESGSMDLGKTKRKQAASIVTGLCLFEIEDRQKFEQDILYNELKNTILRYIDISRNGRSFTSVLFGMGQISDEGVIKKLAEQISAIVYEMPHALHMDKEFELLQRAALSAFNETFPNREHLLKKA